MDFLNLNAAERHELNVEYLPRLSLGNVDERLARSSARSAAIRNTLGCHIDVPYGDSPGQTLDIFPAATAGAPLFFFIHGGYWRAMDKDIYSEIAGPMRAAGATTMLVNYDLCPAVTIPDIVAQVRNALVWAHSNTAKYNADSERIFISGHSAGGHLTGMLMATDWDAHSGLPRDLIKGAAPLSGLFDIEPHRHTDLQADIALTAEAAAANSPQYLPLYGNPSVLCAVGGGESDSFKSQSKNFAQKCREAGLECEYRQTGNDNHFDITDRLGQNDDPLTRSLIAMMGLA